MAPPPVSSTRARTTAPLAQVREKPMQATQAGPAAEQAEAWVAKNAPRPRVTAAAVGKKAPPAPALDKLQAPSSTPVDLSNVADRVKLAQQASQLNPISEAAGNKNVICGGAVVVSALIMNSTTPEAAKKNAGALESAMNAAGARDQLAATVNPEALKAAFANFAKGTPSLDDVHLMQQAAYAVGRRYDAESTGGLNPGQLAGLVADLKGRGATLGPETRFTVVANPKAPTVGHWVASAGPIELNTDASVSVSSRNRLPSGQDWSGDVSVRKDGFIEARTRYLGSNMAANGRGWAFEIEPVDLSKVGSRVQLTKGDHRNQLVNQTRQLLSDPAATEGALR